MTPLSAALLTYALCLGLLVGYALMLFSRLRALSRRETGKDKP